MAKKKVYISFEEFSKTMGEGSAPLEAIMSLYEYIKDNKVATNKWRELSQTNDFKNNMTFLLNYASSQSERLKTKDKAIQVLAGVIGISLGTGVVALGLNQFEQQSKDYVTNTYGPHGTKIEDIQTDEPESFGMTDKNCNCGINLTLNNKDKYYSNSVVLITNLKYGMSKSLRVVDATKPVRVVAEPGDYQIMLVTLPNGDVCGNVYNATVEEGCFKNLDISAKYQQTKDRVR